MKNLGFIIKCVRKFHLGKARELAVKVGISQSYLSEIESGKKLPGIEVLDKIAEQYKMWGWQLLQLAQSHEAGMGLLINDHKKTEMIFEWLKEVEQ